MSLRSSAQQAAGGRGPARPGTMTVTTPADRPDGASHDILASSIHPMPVVLLARRRARPAHRPTARPLVPRRPPPGWGRRDPPAVAPFVRPSQEPAGHRADTPP